MFGPQGALPLTTTEEAYGWLRDRDDAFPRFVDIFQGRFLQLFFRAWADAHPVTQNDRPEEDRFRTYIGAMIGIGAPAFRNADSIPDASKLEFAGLLAPRVKSASRLRAFLTRYLRTRVEIEEFVGAWLTLDRSDCTSLGAANSRLGVDCVAGASMYGSATSFASASTFAISNISGNFFRARRSRGKSQTLFSFTSEQNTTGIWSWRSRPARSRRFALANPCSSAGRVGWRPIGRTPTRRSAPTRGSMSSAALRNSVGRAKTN